jgi:eukaryotic-like serine/threonine-protein kinase
MSSDEDPVLLQLAADISDGAEVDWESERWGRPELDRALAGLMRVQSLARALRAIHESSGDDLADDAFVAGTPAVQRDEILNLEGKSWGPLQVRERIGSGGFGVVYRAFDPSLQRDVALKIWREEAVRTTGTEARRLASVKQANILVVHGTARHDGFAGMWTELLEGVTLEESLKKEGPFSFPEVQRIGVELCHALETIHQRGMLHRDVKTFNVARESDGRVVLLDFGSVGDLGRKGVLETTQRRGTPLSMAPEVLKGQEAGPAADIYGLGVLLYRILTGHYPIEAETLKDLLEAHGRHVVTPIVKWRADVPAGLARVIETALSADPRQRFQSAEAMGVTLEAVRSAEGADLSPAAAASSRTGALGRLRARIAGWFGRRG